MPTAEYFSALEDSKRHHAAHKTFSGRLLRPHAPFIKEIIDRLGCRTVLDYGAGKGEQYRWRCDNPLASMPLGMTIEQYWGVEVVKYDPAYPPFAKEPTGKFDLVICTHTLGAIPISDLPWAIDRLYSLADKAIYVAEKIGPVKKKVLSHPENHPFGWSPAQWMTAVKRESPVEVTLSIKEKRDDGVHVDRFRI